MNALQILKRGDSIPGSRYVRDFCVGCGDPIRVTKAKGPSRCVDCDTYGSRNKHTRGKPIKDDEFCNSGIGSFYEHAMTAMDQS